LKEVDVIVKFSTVVKELRERYLDADDALVHIEPDDVSPLSTEKFGRAEDILKGLGFSNKHDQENWYEYVDDILVQNINNESWMLNQNRVYTDEAFLFIEANFANMLKVHSMGWKLPCIVLAETEHGYLGLDGLHRMLTTCILGYKYVRGLVLHGDPEKIAEFRKQINLGSGFGPTTEEKIVLAAMEHKKEGNIPISALAHKWRVDRSKLEVYIASTAFKARFAKKIPEVGLLKPQALAQFERSRRSKGEKVTEALLVEAIKAQKSMRKQVTAGAIKNILQDFSPDMTDVERTKAVKIAAVKLAERNNTPHGKSNKVLYFEAMKNLKKVRSKTNFADLEMTKLEVDALEEELRTTLKFIGRSRAR
jgi:hypothetical protein